MRRWENWQKLNKVVMESMFNPTSTKQGIYSDYYSCVINFLNGMKRKSIAIIDVGCGPGVAYESLKQRLDRKFTYYGIDVTPGMIEIAQERYPEADFQVGDLFKLDRSNFRYDIVLCKDVIEHLPPLNEKYNYKEALEILARIAKKHLILNFYNGLNGRPTKIAWNGPYYSFYENTYNRNEILNILEVAGTKPEIINNSIVLAAKEKQSCLI